MVWKLREVKLVNSFTHTIPGFHASKTEKLTSFKSSAVSPFYKGHCSPRLHSDHISTITLLGTAPGHTKQPIDHNGIIVSRDRTHCRPCFRIYSPPPVLWPSPLTSAASSHAPGVRACEDLCLPGFQCAAMTQAYEVASLHSSCVGMIQVSVSNERTRGGGGVVSRVVVGLTAP